MRTTVRLAAALISIAAATCGGPPKQAEVPDVTTDTGADMQGEGLTANKAAEENKAGQEEVKASEGEMHAKCCAECKEGMAKDRTGSKPETVPCADFTDVLKPWCLEHFRAKPAMASECK